MRATDREGAATQSVFYLQTLESRLLYSVPVTDDINFRHRITDEGMWLYWQNNPSIEQLHLNSSYGTMSDTTCSIKREVSFKLSVNADADSVLLPQILIEPGRDVGYSLTATPENWRGLGQPARYSVRLYDGPMKDSSLLRRLDFASSFRVEEYTDSLSIVLVAKDLSIPGCGGAITVYQLEKGEIVSTHVLFSGNSAIYHLRTGVPYAFYAEVGNRFVSDTFYIHEPYSLQETPIVVGSLEWDISCQKRIKKSTWIHNYYSDLDWQWEASSMFSFRDSLDYMIVEPLHPGSIGSEKLRVQIRDKGGYMIDTSVFIRQVTSNQVPVAMADTIHLVIPYAWIPINLLAYIQDQETPDSLMVVNIVRQGGLRLKDHSFRTEILGGIDLVGQDTLTVEAWDEGCAMTQMTFLVSYDTTGANNKRPMWITTESIYGDISDMTPKFDVWSKYFLVEDTTSFPTRIDLRKYIQDDSPFEELTFHAVQIGDIWGNEIGGEMLERGLDIRIKDGFMTIRPREGVYYGYPFWDNERKKVAGFAIRLYAVDRFGAKSSKSIDDRWIEGGNHFYIDLTHRGELVFDGRSLRSTYYLCGADTLALDFGEILERSNPGRIVPDFNISGAYGDAMQLPHIEVIRQSNKYLYTRREDFVLPGTYTTSYSLKLQPAAAPFLDNVRRELCLPPTPFDIPGFTIVRSDECPEALGFGKFPVQNMNDSRESVVRPDKYITGGQQGEAYFWRFSGGTHLAYSYDDIRGELKATWTDPNWRGTDTLWVSIEDYKGRQGASYIVYANSEAPIIYPKPSDLSVRNGEPIPTLSLWNMVWDDATAAKDIVWQVQIGESVIQSEISESGVLSFVVLDSLWTGAITVKLIATNEVGLSDTAVFTLEILESQVTGIYEEICVTELYPNPVGDLLRVQLCTDVLEGGSLHLLDMLGKERIGKKVSGKYIELNVSDLESGMYILRIEDNTGKNGYVNKVLISSE